MSELELPGSRRASTPGGVGARHRLRGGSGRSNVLGLIEGPLLRDLRVLDTQFTSALDLSHRHGACFSRPRQPTCSAPTGPPTVNCHSDLTPNIVLHRAACENGAREAALELNYDILVMYPTAVRGRPRSAVCGDAERGPDGGSGRSQARGVCP